MVSGPKKILQNLASVMWHFMKECYSCEVWEAATSTSIYTLCFLLIVSSMFLNTEAHEPPGKLNDPSGLCYDHHFELCQLYLFTF